jgi:hypothetical protein
MEGAIMFFRNLLRCTVAFALAIPLSALAGSMNVKPGAWEMTATSVTSGMSAPVDATANMPSDQRAMMEKAMQAYAAKPRTIVTKSCVTKEDLDEDRMFKDDEGQKCTKKIISKSANKMVIEMICSKPQASKATITTEAKSPESIASSMDMMQGNGGKIHVDVKGRWLGASCEGIKG